MLRSINSIWRRWSIRWKIMTSFSLIFIASISAAILLLMLAITSSYTAQVQYSAEQSFVQAKDFLENKLQSITYVMSLMYTSDDVQEVLLRNHQGPQGASQSIVTQYGDVLRLEKKLDLMRVSSDIAVVRLYVDDWLMYANQGVYFTSMSSLQRDKQSVALLSKKEYGRVWRPPFEEVILPSRTPQRYISLLRIIRNASNYTEVLGVGEVAVKAQLIDDILSNSAITKSGAVMLVNARGQVISTSNDLAIPSAELAALVAKGTQNKWDYLTLNETSYYTKSVAVQHAEWTLIALIPQAELNAPAHQMRNILLVVLAVTVLVTVVFSLFLSKTFSKRLLRLSNQMRLVEQGAFDQLDIPDRDTLSAAEYAGADEISQLNDRFRYMLGQLNQMGTRLFDAGREIRGLEIKALQAQINPHFLYNVLDLINWEARSGHNEKVVSITKELATFYKTGLSKGKDIICIREEVRHIAAYVQIQNYRFDDAIHLELALEEAVCGCKIPKLILQPLVENAVLHGMVCDGRRAQITIRITANAQGGCVLIVVEDDGVGMPPQVLDQLRTDAANSDNNDSEHGYGIHNINTRLKLQYGQAHTLSFSSEPGKGTVVQFLLPNSNEDEP